MIRRPSPSLSSRREFLRRSGCGFGSVALAALCAEQAAASDNPLAPKLPHFAPRAKRVIFMWMQGGPSQIDMFDYKPRLEKQNGEPIPYELPGNRAMPGFVGSHLMGPISSLNRQGESGLWVTDMLPILASMSTTCVCSTAWKLIAKHTRRRSANCTPARLNS